VSAVAGPLARGSISLRLYPLDLPPRALVAEVMEQARLAEEVGFDGVMLSEHHGGFPNYLPNPMLAATWALEATSSAWAAACPLLLPLRPVSQIAEDLAWTSHRFPGRLGAGFAAGALELDFEMAGVPFEEMNDRFRAALPEVVAALRGAATGAVGRDSGVAALADAPLPMVSAAQSPAAGRRAGGLGIGLLFDSLVSIERAASVSAAHQAAGGGGARVLIRRAWVGTPPESSTESQMARYARAAPDAARAHWAPDGGLVASPDPAEVAERLLAQARAAGCDALNLRVFQAGMSGAEVRGQIERLGAEVVPSLRASLVPPS
jgi:alkanesulfonate monooxygenase SsuD/methylene tetrahydromethanopterin reductase-like flavin-dependent oxidoreductase (luciferase family)